MSVYRTKLSEAQVLSYFAQAANDPEVDRIALLHQLANMAVVPRVADARYWTRRNQRAYHLKFERCFACRNADRYMVWHHVIQVQHGGSGSAGNLVGLCEDCHARVHPWLESTGRERRGWVRVGDFIKSQIWRLERWLQQPAANDQPF